MTDITAIKPNAITYREYNQLQTYIRSGEFRKVLPIAKKLMPDFNFNIPMVEVFILLRSIKEQIEAYAAQAVDSYPMVVNLGEWTFEDFLVYQEAAMVGDYDKVLSMLSVICKMADGSDMEADPMFLEGAAAVHKLEQAIQRAIVDAKN